MGDRRPGTQVLHCPALQQPPGARHIEPAGFAGVAEGAFVRLVRVAAAVHGTALGAQVVNHTVAHGLGIAAGVFGGSQVAGVLAVVQESDLDDGGGDAQTLDESEEATPDNTPVPDAGEEDAADAEALPTSGLPIGWPDNDYTKLVPAPDCGGKVLTSGEIGTLFAIELKWSMEQGLTYAQLLQDAGFGEDCVEKYEQYGYIDRTYNGVNVQLLDVFGAASLSIMPVETE